MDKAHIANHYLQACIRGAQTRGHRASDLLAAAGIPLDQLNQPGQRVTSQQLTRLIKTVWRSTRDEFMGLATQESRPGTFALMCDYCISCSTLGAMLARSAHFYSVITPGLALGLEQNPGADGLLFFRLHLANSDKDSDHLLQEFMMLMWQRFGSWLTDQQLPVAVTQFSYAPPPHVEEYRLMYEGELRFNQECCGFYLHPRALNLALVRSNSELQSFLDESPANVFHRPRQDQRLCSRIRLLLSQCDYAQMPSLEALSCQLYLSPRTIARKLKDEGTSFTKLKSALRREHAMTLLATEHLSIGEISKRLGFSETGSFCRAFKRWTGHPPTAWPPQDKTPKKGSR